MMCMYYSLSIHLDLWRVQNNLWLCSAPLNRIMSFSVQPWVRTRSRDHHPSYESDLVLVGRRAHLPVYGLRIWFRRSIIREGTETNQVSYFSAKKTAAPIWSKSSDTSLLADGEIILSPLQFGWMGPFDSDTHIFIGDQGTNRWHLSISILSDTTKILLSPGEDFFPIYIIYVKLQ
jgi:hypothetical protein